LQTVAVITPVPEADKNPTEGSKFKPETVELSRVAIEAEVPNTPKLGIVVVSCSGAATGTGPVVKPPIAVMKAL
jgi:hypothetical protein